tara:strand:- start:4892 stop:5437 length:546 start_codon:yes stop_codon:yes gene_type:complete
MNKSILRKNLLIKRSKVKNRSQNEFKIFQRLETIINNNSLIVAGYLSVRSEVNLNLFLSFLLKNKFSLCLPYIENLKSPLIFKKFSMNTKLVRGKYNIMHPNNEIILIPNIILIPLVGFDESKNRIGYGGGYYDRTIEHLEKKNDVLKLGVAFDEQETIKIPNGKYDKKLDVIITPTRLIT